MRTVLAVCLVGGLAGSGQAALVESDLGAALNGGGCYPPGLTVTGPTDPTLVNPVNPEWAPVVDGMAVDSDPVLIHGTVVHAHGEIGDDFPATHVRSDVVAKLQLDAADMDLLATGNVQTNEGLMNLEWEVGALPPFAWPQEGARIVALGRWIFDCGEPGPIPGHCSMTTTQACILDTDCAPPACSSCGALRLVAQGASKACIDTLSGQSLGTDLALLGGPDNLIACLSTASLDAGTIDLSYPGPDFGAGPSGVQEYVTSSISGEGGVCSDRTTLLCQTSADCPAGESCSGAFALQYRIERLQ